MSQLAPAHDVLNILVAEDDPNDLFLLTLAFRRAKRDDVSLCFLDDGQQIADYLAGNNRFADRLTYPIPSLLLLDLAMPRFDGLQLLEWLDSHRSLIHFPIVVLTASENDADFTRATGFDFVTAYLLKSERLDHIPGFLQQILSNWPNR